MADTKISGLTAKTTLGDSDLIPIVDIEATPDETKKITVANAKTYLVTAAAVNTAGAVMESDGLSVSNDGTKTTVAGTVGDYNRIGEGDTTNHSLDSENDFMVTGELEVKGATFIDGAVTVGSTVDGRDLDTDGTKLDTIATSANAYVHPNHSGEVTSVADGAQTIAADAVTYAKMQNVSATDKVLGRATAGAGNVEEIACTAAGRALLDDATAAAQKTTLSLNNVENTAHSTDAHTMTIDGVDVSAHVTDTSTHGASDIADVSDIAVDANLSGGAQAVVTAGACDVDANLSSAAQAVVTAGACDVDANLSSAAQAIITNGLVHADVDDTAVNGETTVPVSSNWAFDHDAATTGVHGAAASVDILTAAILRNNFQMIPTAAGWTEDVNGSGVVGQQPFRNFVYINLTAGSYAELTASAYGFNEGGTYQFISWEKELWLIFNYSRYNDHAQTEAWVQLLSTNSGHADLPSEGIGIVVKDMDLYGESYGTSRVEHTLNITCVHQQQYQIAIHYSPENFVKWYVDGVLKATEDTTNEFPAGAGDATIFLNHSIYDGGTATTRVTNSIMMGSKIIQAR